MTAVTLVSIGCFLAANDALPAPMLTGYVSLDEKLRFIRENKINDVELVGIGSSHALNNLSTEVIKQIPVVGEKYFNFSYWGLNVYDLSVYWDFLSQLFHPKIMIICLNPYEFVHGRRLNFNEKDLREYIKGKNPFPYYLKYRGLYFLKRIKSVGRKRRSNRTLGSLSFDEAGGVYLDVPPRKDKRGAWNEVFKWKFHIKNYDVFDDMLEQLNKENIQVVYVVSPMKKRFIADDETYRYFGQHWDQVKSILDKHGMHFLNLHKILSLEDHFFADNTHLNRTGARLFTEKLVEQMEKEGVFQKVNGLMITKNEKGSDQSEIFAD